MYSGLLCLQGIVKIEPTPVVSEIVRGLAHWEFNVPANNHFS